MTMEKLKKQGREVLTKRVTLEPVKVLWKQGEVENEQMLLERRSRQISLVASSPVVMKTTSEQQASVLLDYGTEIHGGIRILVWGEGTGKGAKVRVRFGESASEAMAKIGGENNATNDHARRDLVTEVGMMSMNPIGETGFRFVRLDLLEETTLVLKAVTAELVYKDVPYRGSFRSSDELLNKIWETGAYTVHLNMQEYIWDGIKRDRLVWVGDMHPETLTIRSVFGADDAVERSLDFIREETPLPGWMNTMAAYSMWYVIIVYDWFLYTGHLDWVKAQADYLKGLSDQLSEHIDSEGKDTVTQGRFLDWPSNDNPVVTDAGVQAIHYLAADSLEKLFEALGEKEYAERCAEDKKRLVRYETDYQEAKQAAALLVLAGLKDADKVNEELLRKNGAAGMSTFMGYYILAARAAAGDYTGCLESIREYWGGMLKLGATTFWEDFDVEWMKNAAPIDRLPEEGEVDVHKTYGRYCYQGYRHSFCHGWASGATAWMSEYVLGVKILEPGCKKVKITPHLGDLDWVEGTYPTPLGEIHIRAEKTAEGTRVCINAPEGVTVTE